MPIETPDLLQLCLCGLGLISGWWAFGHPRRLPTTRDGERSAEPSTVTVVVPARDEELSIGGLLDDLALIGTDIRIVVVDDHSTDRTSDVVRLQQGVTLMQAPDLPSGWTGKSWACHVGASAALEGTLVFVDADVRLSPKSLDAALVEHRRRGGLVSVQPWHDALRPYERLSAMFNVVALMGAGAGGRRPVAAFGPVLVTSVEDYRSIGGHEAVRRCVAEDLALGRRYVASGLAMTLISCDRRIRFRMYPGGVRQLVDGWTKNYAIGAGSLPPLRLLATGLWIVFLGTASVAAIEALSRRQVASIGVLLYAVAVGQAAVIFRRAGRFGIGTAVLLPAHIAFFLVVFARSLWRTHVRRSVVWRGRTLRVDPIDRITSDLDRRS